MQQQIHATEPGDAVHQLDAVERTGLEFFLLGAVERVVFGNVIVRGEQEPTGPAGGIADRLAGLRSNHLHHRGDQGARREILAGTAFHVLSVLLQQPLVSIALHIGGEAGPLFLIDQIDDEAAELGRVLNLVLRLAKDNAEHARPFPECFEHVPVMRLQFVAVKGNTILGQEARPIVPLGHGRRFIKRRLALLLGHLEEQEKCQLLDVIAIRQAVIAQDGAIVPKFLDELRCVAHVIVL